MALCRWTVASRVVTSDNADDFFFLSLRSRGAIASDCREDGVWLPARLDHLA